MQAGKAKLVKKAISLYDFGVSLDILVSDLRLHDLLLGALERLDTQGLLGISPYSGANALDD